LLATIFFSKARKELLLVAFSSQEKIAIYFTMLFIAVRAKLVGEGLPMN